MAGPDLSTYGHAAITRFDTHNRVTRTEERTRIATPLSPHSMHDADADTDSDSPDTPTSLRSARAIS